MAVRPDLVVVGLGNPGAKYAGTRHNAGFDVADRVAGRLGAVWAKAGDAGLVAEGDWEGRRVAVVKPQAFMNRSGAAVADVLRRTGVGPDALLVVTDDLALPVGQIRLRPKGGAGGHNGLADVADVLGSPEWARLRVGVGRDFAPGTQVDYVLAPFEADERETAEAAYDRATEAVLAVVTDGLPSAMGRFNGRA
ncbi:MAG TPA: aminoacyl-tRNA hydrolase [Rubricoccaceae bacterium]